MLLAMAREAQEKVASLLLKLLLWELVLLVLLWGLAWGKGTLSCRAGLEWVAAVCEEFACSRAEGTTRVAAAAVAAALAPAVVVVGVGRIAVWVLLIWKPVETMQEQECELTENEDGNEFVSVQALRALQALQVLLECRCHRAHAPVCG